MLLSTIIELSSKGLANVYIPLSIYALLTVGICWFFLRKEEDEFVITSKNFLIIVFSFIVGIRLFEVLLIHTQPISDAGIILNGAKGMLDGNFGIGLDEGGYWDRWNYQLGFTFYEYLVLKLFNTRGILVLKILNVMWSSLISLYIYKIAKCTFGESTARISTLLSGFYLPHIFSVSLLTNQHLSAFFVVFSIYLISKRNYNRTSYYVVGLTLALAHLIRPVGPVFLTAVIIFIVFYTHDSIRKRVGNMLKIASSFLITIIIVSLLFISLGMTDRMLFDQKMPSWKFLVGSNVESNGHIGDFEKDLMNQFNGEWNKDYDRFDTEAKKEISRRIKSLGVSGVIKFSYSKFQEFWGSHDNMFYWSVSRDEHAKEMFVYYLSGSKIIGLSMLQLVLLYILSVISLISVFKNKDYFKHNLLYICLSGYIAIHILAEIQTRYRYSIMPILFIIAGHGMAGIVEKGLDAKKNINLDLSLSNKKLIYGASGFLVVILLLFGIARSDEDLRIREIEISNIGSRYIFSVKTAYVNDPQYAWYIFKNDVLEEVISYSNQDTFSRSFDEGEYYVQAFVKNSEGRNGTMYSERIMIDKSNFNTQIHSVEKNQLQDHVYNFVINVLPENEMCQYAWYVYEDSNIIEKIPYSSDNELTYNFMNEGNYVVEYFLKSENNVIKGSFRNIIVK